MCVRRFWWNDDVLPLLCYYQGTKVNTPIDRSQSPLKQRAWCFSRGQLSLCTALPLPQSAKLQSTAQSTLQLFKNWFKCRQDVGFGSEPLGFFPVRVLVQHWCSMAAAWQRRLAPQRHPLRSSWKQISFLWSTHQVQHLISPAPAVIGLEW